MLLKILVDKYRPRLAKGRLIKGRLHRKILDQADNRPAQHQAQQYERHQGKGDVHGGLEVGRPNSKPDDPACTIGIRRHQCQTF
jgi:hypothetical protein